MSFKLNIKTAEDIASEKTEKLAKQVRDERNKLLDDSDWVIIRAQETGEDIPQDWITYRNALRDITDQPGFPEDLTWPEKPE